MSEAVSYDADNQVMHVRVWGHDSISEMLASRAEVTRLYETHGTSRLIVDARDQETAPALFDIFDFGETWPRNIRVAILASSKTPEDILILETVANHRGKTIRVFFKEAEALEWIKES